MAFLASCLGIHTLAESPGADTVNAAVLGTEMREDAFNALAEGLPDRMRNNFKHSAAEGGIVMKRPGSGRTSSAYVADMLFVALTHMYRNVPHFALD